jgi:hypothetical protein
VWLLEVDESVVKVGRVVSAMTVAAEEVAVLPDWWIARTLIL